jgi:hypothetical protein
LLAVGFEPASFFGGHFGNGELMAINPKKDLALMATSNWKTLKTIENLAEKNFTETLPLGTYVNVANSVLSL